MILLTKKRTVKKISDACDTKWNIIGLQFL